LWTIDVLKPERQRLTLKQQWTRLKLIVQVRPERTARVSQLSNPPAGGNPFADPDGD
jgi:hypothetical protein